MSQQDAAYLSAAAKGMAENIIKRSRFITYVFPLQNEAEAISALAQVREAHPDATHVCYAYKAGLVGEAIRCSDAGEPSGTAGRPILEVLTREELRNTLIAVVRYFGGTLLGAGGLTRAYSSAAAAGVAAAGKAEYLWHQEFLVRMAYHHYSRVEHLLQNMGYTPQDSAFSDQVTFRLAIPSNMVNPVISRLTDTTDGQVTFTEMAAGYRPIR